MMDDEVCKLMVVNKIVCEYMYYVLKLYYGFHKIVCIMSLLENNCE